MILGNTQQIILNKRRYFVERKTSGFDSYETSSEKNCYLYVRFNKNGISGIVECREDIPTRTEQILNEYGTIKSIKKHFYI